MSGINFEGLTDERGFAKMDVIYERFVDSFLELLEKSGDSIEIKEPHNTKEATDKLFEHLKTLKLSVPRECIEKYNLK